MTQELVEPIARNLRRLRERQNLSISAVADRAAVSKSTLSKLERGIGNPSIDTLWALARVLGVPFASLFEDEGEPSVDVLRYARAPIVTGPGRLAPPGSSIDGVDLRHLESFEGRGRVEAYSVALDAGVRHASGAHTPGIVEHVLVIEGRADVGPDDDSVQLDTGDRIRFPADRPHHYEALDGRPARLIAILDYP
ncbi:MAG: helix-turn-helix domain-containing protein [Thermoleophilia bacterium]